MRKNLFVIILVATLLLLLSACAVSDPVPLNGQCLAFISTDSGAYSLMASCDGVVNDMIEGAHSVEDVTYVSDGKKLFFSGVYGDKLGIFSVSGDQTTIAEFVLCPDNDCMQIAAGPNSAYLAYSSIDSRGQVVLRDLSQDEQILIEDGAASFLDFSPGGNYFRYFSTQTGKLNIISLPDLQLTVSLPGDADLIGSWISEAEFVYGKRRADGQIALIDYWTYDLNKRSELPIFNDLQEGIQIYFPKAINDDVYAVLVRTGYRENSRQIWLVDALGNTLAEITSDKQYDHANLAWSDKNKKLSYQRFSFSGSNTVPEIWVWDSETSLQTLISLSAVKPVWLD